MVSIVLIGLIICATISQGVGVGLTVLRHSLRISSIALQRRMLVSLEINNKDPAYDWFLAWMSQQSARAAENPRWLSPSSWTRSHQLSVQTAYEQRKNGSASVFFKLVAGPGTHLMRYQRSWIQVSQDVAHATRWKFIRACRSNGSERLVHNN